MQFLGEQLLSRAVRPCRCLRLSPSWRSPRIFRRACPVILFGAVRSFFTCDWSKLVTDLLVGKTSAGYAGFDPLGFSDYYDIKWLQEAEIKHGRICMLAAVGMVSWQLVEWQTRVPQDMTAGTVQTCLGRGYYCGMMCCLHRSTHIINIKFSGSSTRNSPSSPSSLNFRTTPLRLSIRFPLAAGPRCALSLSH